MTETYEVAPVATILLTSLDDEAETCDLEQLPMSNRDLNSYDGSQSHDVSLQAVAGLRSSLLKRETYFEMCNLREPEIVAREPMIIVGPIVSCHGVGFEPLELLRKRSAQELADVRNRIGEADRYAVGFSSVPKDV